MKEFWKFHVEKLIQFSDLLLKKFILLDMADRVNWDTHHSTLNKYQDQ